MTVDENWAGSPILFSDEKAAHIFPTGTASLASLNP